MHLDLLSVCFWLCLISLILSLKLCLFVFFSGAKGGGQEIKELPGGSPSIHISVGARGKGTEGEREKEKGEEECESRLL